VHREHDVLQASVAKPVERRARGAVAAAAGEDRQVPQLTILPLAKRPKSREKREDRQDRQSFSLTIFRGLTIFRELDDLAV